MKKGLLFILIVLISINARSANLLQIFQQALIGDPVYQKAVIKANMYEEDIAISRSYLLPNVQFRSQPLIDAQVNSGAIVTQGLEPHTNTIRSNDMRLTISQPIFDFALFSRLSASKLSAREAVARLNSESQGLMLRVVKAYFNVLRDEKNIAYLAAHKKRLSKQLYDVEQKHKAGKTTITSLYTIQSAYSAAESDYISAETHLASSKEHLITITGCDFSSLSDLNEKIPYVLPQPANVEQWVKQALENNWLIRANQLGMQAAMEKIKQHFSNHLPTLNVQAYYDNQPFHYNHGSLLVAPGSSITRNTAALINFNVPIYSGGLVTATVKKSQYYYRLAGQQLEASMRAAVYKARQGYLNVFSNIEKIKHYKIAIKAARSSLKGLKERYYAGGGNLIDILNQQEKLVGTQMQYNSACYAYIIQLLELKKAAGTLCTNDLYTINRWLKSS